METVYIINNGLFSLDNLLKMLFNNHTKTWIVYMINRDQKDEIIRFVLDSSDEENEDLAVFMAGIQAREQAAHRRGISPGNQRLSAQKQGGVGEDGKRGGV
jgi:hypothetical protein